MNRKRASVVWIDAVPNHKLGLQLQLLGPDLNDCTKTTPRVFQDQAKRERKGANLSIKIS